MRLDHLSYVTSHEQLADTVQRLGSRLGSTFVDGGIHPRFGTRNFTAAMQNGYYLEVVCPLDHPASEQSIWGKAVSQKSREGGGWLTWVFSVEDISQIEKKFGRSAVDGHRQRPDGSDLKWKQIGVKEITESQEFPFFIEWLSADHPSHEGTPNAEIQKIVIADQNQLAGSWFKQDVLSALGTIDIEWVHPTENDGRNGLVEVHLLTSTGLVVID